jgi:pSer/pThr/pTyr-binding forkhead associated (FHA) protein
MDLNSGNGTILNGSKIYQEQSIESGDQLQLGRVELIVDIK